MNKVRLGIVSFAHVHAYSYIDVISNSEKVELFGIYDDYEKRGKIIAKRYNTRFFSDIDEFLTQSGLDGIIITAENARHKELSLLALKHKKPVLCEKPIATSLEDAIEMKKSFEKEGIPLMIAFPVRYHPILQDIKKRIDNGEIGKVVAITATNRGKFPGGWFGIKELAGGGALMDHIVHVADLTRWLLRDEFEKVYAIIGRNIRETLPVEDNGVIMAKTKKGVYLTLDSSWAYPSNYPYWGDVNLRVIGEKGALEAKVFYQNIEVFSKNGPLWEDFADPSIDLLMIEDFAKVIKKKGEIPITSEDGINALKIVLAAYKSYQIGDWEYIENER